MNKDILNTIKAVYFIGAGGIGMSAIAEFFLKAGIYTAGYDKTPSRITDNLIKEGAGIHFNDDINLIPGKIIDISKEDVLIIYTPAIPESHTELNYFFTNNYTVLKRSEILRIITSQSKVLAVAGTHGKTSVSTIIAHIFKSAEKDVNAFLGGISKNYNSNLILSTNPKNAEFSVAEADEFDRSFLKLFPKTAVITSIDEDHLDIYKDLNDIRNTFEQFISQIDKNGNLIIKNTLKIHPEVFPQHVFTYAFSEKSDYYAKNIKTNSMQSHFDIVTPEGIINDVIINIPGNINIENVVAAAATADIHGISHQNIKDALFSWQGVKRRFDYIINTPDLVYINDYAHHPKELSSFIHSVKNLYPDKNLIGIFQPHLYSRTRDFADEFARSLCLCNEIILLNIYPAREDPIPGVSSKIIFDKMKLKNKILIKKEELPEILKVKENSVYMTMGAGDIDEYTKKIKSFLLKK
ncbi:MAG: UDP-N-acetylmuramate--L-alanine ligase [Chlorobi bacterium]|nr:UDP-N-acetylmuramate--L-alanine ligase [Chlorobiota bacterium]